MVNLIIYTNAFIDIDDVDANIEIYYEALRQYAQLLDIKHDQILQAINVYVPVPMVDLFAQFYAIENTTVRGINDYRSEPPAIAAHGNTGIYTYDGTPGGQQSEIVGNDAAINVFINCHPINDGFSSSGNIVIMHNLQEFQATLCCKNFRRLQLYNDRRSLRDIDYMVRYHPPPYSGRHNFIDSKIIDTRIADWDARLGPNDVVTFHFSNEPQQLYHNGVSFQRLTYTDLDDFKLFLNRYLGGRLHVAWTIAANDSTITNLFKSLNAETTLTQIYFPEDPNIYWFAMNTCANYVNPELVGGVGHLATSNGPDIRGPGVTGKVNAAKAQKNADKMNRLVDQIINENIYGSYQAPLVIPTRNEWITTMLHSRSFVTGEHFYRKSLVGYAQMSAFGDTIY